MARYFIPQELLDGWVLEGKIELAGNLLKIVSEDCVYQLLPGVHFLKLAAGEDRLRLLDKVKTEEQLASLSAELYMSSVLVGEDAYDVQSGFLAQPRQRMEATLTAAVPPASIAAAAQVAPAASDERSQLAKFLLDNLS